MSSQADSYAESLSSSIPHDPIFPPSLFSKEPAHIFSPFAHLISAPRSTPVTPTRSVAPADPVAPVSQTFIIPAPSTSAPYTSAPYTSAPFTSATPVSSTTPSLSAFLLRFNGFC